MRFQEIIFFLAGAGMLLALFYLPQGNYTLWYLAKLFYFAGVILFIYNLKVRKKND